jgi:hypothetical protein
MVVLVLMTEVMEDPTLIGAVDLKFQPAVRLD